MDKQTDTALRELYNDIGPKRCAEKLGISYRACAIRASRLGIAERRKNMARGIRQQIRILYPKTSAKECAAELGIVAQTVRSIASQIGVTGRRQKTRYSQAVNAEFFDSWTKESAYVLGLIYADGGMRKDRISIYQNEAEYLGMIRRVMRIRNAIRPHGTRCHVLCFNNWHMADKLRTIGVRERKSFGNMVFPLEIPDDLYGHFFRGFFDGDGSVGIYGKWRNLRISLWGQRDFIERMFSDVMRLVGTQNGGIRRSTSKRMDFYCCSWGSAEDTEKISQWMYNESGEMFLERKRKVVDGYWATR